MNTEKILKAIQILIKEEMKETLPKIVKQVVKKETASLVKENKELKKMINELSSNSQNLNENIHQMDKTMSFNSNSSGAGVDGLRAQMAAKMGLPDMSVGAQPNGIGVDTGNSVINKALNRNYSDLMKAIDKKKGPWRPGM